MLIVKNIERKQCTVCRNCIHAYFYLVHLNVFQLVFLLLQVPCSKYSPTSHDLSHPHSKLLGFQIDPLSHMLLSTNSLHSHLHLSLFQYCLLLQTLLFSLHLHSQISCHSMCLVSLVLHISSLVFVSLVLN